METHVLQLATSIRPSVRSMVCCLDPSPEYLRLLKDADIEHVNLQCPRLTTPRVLLRYVALERIVDRFRPDVVHTYGFASDVLGTMLRMRRSDVRVITSRRGEDANRRHQRIRRLANRWSDRVVCVSSEVASFVEATEQPTPGLLEVIPNGVAIHSRAVGRTVPDGGPLRFGTLGTVKPIKGTDLLVEAFMRFDATPRVELAIAGAVDRPWAQDLRSTASIDCRIEFLGRSSDPRAFLADLDVFVLPSRSEGMSNALLEAMALGLPCIATDVGSNRSLLNAPHLASGGLICSPTSDALFDSMHRMASDAIARRQYGEGAFRIARDHYTADAMVQRVRLSVSNTCPS